MKHNIGKLSLIIGALMLVTAVCGMQHVPAETRPPTEYQVKAAFLYNFAKFVEWPDRAFSGSTAPLNICVVGKNPFNEYFDDIRDKTVGGRPISIQVNPDSEQLDLCHILFISSSEKHHLAQLIHKLENAGVLTVADMEGFTGAGGMINLFMQDNKVSFDINLKSARRAGLKVSSRLLRLAHTVQE